MSTAQPARPSGALTPAGPALPAGATTAEEVKSCCAAVYSSDWATLLLGDSFHPGGTRLTERLGELLGLGPGRRVLDVASGRGTSAIHLARRFGCEVVGLDLSAAGVAAATTAAAEAGLGDLVRFSEGDAERIPHPDASFDAVISECAFCTFPDKPTAAAEMARVLRPGGGVAISDLTRSADVPAELRDLLAWVACIGDAAPASAYAAHLEAAGLRAGTVEPHDEALAEMVEQIRGRLTGARFLVELGRLELPGVDLEHAQRMARAARQAVADGRLGYAVILAAKPAGAAPS